MEKPLQANWTIEPEWILLGYRGRAYPCGLIACHSLRLAELRIAIEPGPYFPYEGVYGPDLSENAEVTAHMNPRDMVIIEAGSWQECLDELMRIWRPGTGRVQAITAGQGELEHGQ